MELSTYEIKKRHHEKELKSFKNKLGPNTVWFNSLTKEKQFDILFLWKKHKKFNKLTKPEWVKKSKRVPLDPNRPWCRKTLKKVKELEYPPSLKHFIKNIMYDRRFRPKTQDIRNTTITLLLNEEK